MSVPEPRDAGTPALEARELACWFDVSRPRLERLLTGQPQQTLKALDGVSFAIAKGTTYSVVGESGCGKSTLAKVVAGLYRPTHGSLTFAPGGGRDGRMRVQMIFQDPYASLNPRWRVRDIIAEPILTLGLRSSSAQTGWRVDELLDLVGLGRGDGARYPHEFSGGQRQRISIARALATEPEFLVCDEPTSALDVSVQAQILNLMSDLQRELGLTYLFISHNLAVVRHMSSRVAVMYLGKIVEEASADDLFDRPRHPYTRLLRETIPNIESPDRDRKRVAGELPSPISPPGGCAFHPRCDQARPSCATDAPPTRAEGGRMLRCVLQ